MQAGLISNYHRQDIGYLAYLPFSFLFVSSDKAQRNSVAHFLRHDQQFVWGPELKADLGQIAKQYRELPPEELEKGIYQYALSPPPGSLVATLLNAFGNMMMREEQERRKKLFDEPPTEIPMEQTLKPLPQGGPELVAQLNRFNDAPALRPDEVDFDTANPEMLSVARTMHKKRGNLWQLPKDLKSK
jgi:hypothetical protein